MDSNKTTENVSNHYTPVSSGSSTDYRINATASDSSDGRKTDSTQFISPISSNAGGNIEFPLATSGTNRGCERCRRHISSHTLEEEAIAPRQPSNSPSSPKPNISNDRQATVQRVSQFEQELVADKVAGRGCAKKAGEVCKGCDNVPRPKLVLDKTRFHRYWRRTRTFITRAVARVLSEGRERLAMVPPRLVFRP